LLPLVRFSATLADVTQRPDIFGKSDRNCANVT